MGDGSSVERAPSGMTHVRRTAGLLAIVFLCVLDRPARLARAQAGPAPAQTPDTAKKGKKKKPKVRVSGFLTVFYKFRIDQDGDGAVEPDLFRLGKSRIRFKGDLTDHVGYTVEADPRSPTVEGVMRDAYISVRRIIPHHEIRLGQQKTQFGYENSESSTRLYTVTRTELSESLARGVTLRDIGIGVVGKWPLAGGWRIEDAVTVVNGAGFGVQSDDTSLKNVWGRVGLRYRSEDDGLVVRLGVSGAIGDQMGEADPGPPPEPAERFQFRRLGGDVEVDQTWMFLAAEVARGWDEIPADSGEVEKSSAYYVILAGKTPWNIGPLVRYDVWDQEDFRRLTAGAYWGGPADAVRVIVHYEAFEDTDGRHDDRVLSQIQTVF
ncbi:MAG TPA: porin [Kofleriaceae bacterium]|nr:porin [Kofleriaceae bacterium]